MSLDTLQTILLMIYIALTMLLMGFRLTWAQVRLLSEHRGLIGRTLLVNMLIFPLVAFFLIRLIAVPAELAIGLFLAAAAPGAPFAPKFAERVKGPFPVAVALMFVLAIGSVVTTPATVTLFLLRESDAKVLFPAIFFMLVLVQTTPLLIGVAVNSRWSDLTSRLLKPMTISANILVLVVMTLILVTNWGTLSIVDWRTVTVVLLMVLSALLLGWSFGGPALLTRRVLAFTTNSRNVAVALLIAATTFGNIEADIAIMLFSLLMLVTDVALAADRQRDKRTHEHQMVS